MLHSQARSFLDQLDANRVTLPWDCNSVADARRVQQSSWAPGGHLNRFRPAVRKPGYPGAGVISGGVDRLGHPVEL